MPADEENEENEEFDEESEEDVEALEELFNQLDELNEFKENMERYILQSGKLILSLARLASSQTSAESKERHLAFIESFLKGIKDK